MNRYLMTLPLLCGIMMTYHSAALAGDAATTISPTGSILKMVLGLAVVLVIMALISWGVKRVLPNNTAQNAVIKMVGGVSVGSRERVVVLEVAGRWLVVGVAQGQVSAIADIEVGADAFSALASDNAAFQSSDNTKPFSAWLKKSADIAKAKLSNQYS